MSLVYFKFVKVKMLPFDNKSEFQVIVDMPNGTPLEQTARVTQELAVATQQQPEVVNVQTYVGTASPYNFNGLVRHYYLRRGSNVADIQVNLLHKGERRLQSHEIAKQVRKRLVPIAARYGARIKVAEVPPGPPVLKRWLRKSMVPIRRAAYGLPARSAICSAGRTASWTSTGTSKTTSPNTGFVVDKEKAALNGISEEDVARAVVDGFSRVSKPACCMWTRRRRMFP